MSNYEDEYDDVFDFEDEPEDQEEIVLVGREEVEKVIEWLPRAPASFDAKFVWSLHQQIQQKRNLSQKQLESIKNIIVKFRIDLPAQKRKPPVKSGTPYYKNTDATTHYY